MYSICLKLHIDFNISPDPGDSVALCQSKIFVVNINGVCWSNIYIYDGGIYDALVSFQNQIRLIPVGRNDVMGHFGWWWWCEYVRVCVCV